MARTKYKVKARKTDEKQGRSKEKSDVKTKGTAKLEIVRLTGPAKEDKLVIQWAEVPPEETDAQAPFKAGAQAGEVILPLKAE
ncbi:hypothetical protein Y032_0052g2187 [Ancylostoma ceylanicum]|uniref:MSP domain-containing protein n=1 Tax=Ancylostoma ceylanicum TaxID=53326 RepID=A0A016U8A3_9BILA|nr:hypothetical protein Y032_0052g2187 [Ancylostoma ceylanicum]